MGPGALFDEVAAPLPRVARRLLAQSREQALVVVVAPVDEGVPALGLEQLEDEVLHEDHVIDHLGLEVVVAGGRVAQLVAVGQLSSD